MSQSASYRFELERRREIAFTRIRATTLGFVERYAAILTDVRRDGLAGYVPEEVHRLEREIASIRSLLTGDPPAARARSQAIAADVHGLRRLATEVQAAVRQAAAERERAEREAKERARDELEAAWREAISEWPDAAARDLVYTELADLRRRLLAPDAATTVEGLGRELVSLRHEGETRARELRSMKVEATRAAAQQDAAAAALAEVGGASERTAAAARDALAVAASLSPELLAERLDAVASQVDDEAVGEQVRKEVVRGVVQSLRDAGFIAEAPWRRVEAGRDEVVVVARRPAGSRAEFHVTLAGDLTYKFDHYEGTACKKDIATVLPRLDEVYGVKLSDERVVWVNPDDLDRTARARPTGAGEGGHGG